MVVGAEKVCFELKKYLMRSVFCLESYLRDLYNQQCPDNEIDIIKAETELETYEYLLKEFFD